MEAGVRGPRRRERRLSSGASSVEPLFSADENPTQALQLPHVAEQGEQTQEKDEAFEDGDVEFRPLRDKHKAENSVGRTKTMRARNKIA